ALMKVFKQHWQHVTLYSGYTLEELTSRRDARIEEILTLTNILIDGPFVKDLAKNAGEWRGSTNQRIIYNPPNWRSANCIEYLTTGQKFDNLPPDSNIEALEVGH